MLIVTAVFGIVANLAHPVTPTLLKSLNVPSYMFGVAFSAMSLTSFLFSPFWGKISSRLGPAKLVVISFIGYSLGQYLFMIANSEVTVVLARMVAGLFIGGINVCQLLYIVENSELSKRAEVLASNATINAVCGAVGYLIGGFLGDISIMTNFIVQIIGLLLAGVLTWLIVADSERSEADSISNIMKQSNPFYALFNSKGIITSFLFVFFILTVAINFVTTSYDQVFNYFVKDVFDFPPSYNGILKAIVGFSTLVLNSTVCIWILKRTNEKKSLVYLLGVCLCILLGIIFVNDTITIMILNVLFLSLTLMCFPIMQSILANVSKKDNGMIIGLFNSMRSIGQVSGALVAGFVYSVNTKGPFIIGTIILVVCMVAANINYKQTKE